MENILYWAIIFLIIGIVGKLFTNIFLKQKEEEKSSSNTNYKRKDLMTETEKCFYNKLKNLEPQYKVIPQVSLNSVIEKISDKSYHTELFRNIDYGIFTNDLSKLMLLVELNDKTHEDKKRKYRDQKVKNICMQANIPLITFYTNYPNETNYIIDRIKKEIEKNNILIPPEYPINIDSSERS